MSKDEYLHESINKNLEITDEQKTYFPLVQSKGSLMTLTSQ